MSPTPHSSSPTHRWHKTMQNEGYTEMPDFSVSRKICHQSVVVVLSHLSLNSWWFDGFHSHFKGFFDWSGQRYRLFGQQWVRKKERKKCNFASFHLIVAVISRMKPEQGRSYSTAAIYPNRNGTVRYLTGLTLNTANQSFCMALSLIMIHYHTKSDYKKFSGSDDLAWIKSRYKDIL